MSAVPFPVGTVLIGTILLLTGWAFTFFLRRQPVWENALWRIALLSLLVLPPVQVIAPRTFAPRLERALRAGWVYLCKAPTAAPAAPERSAGDVEFISDGTAPAAATDPGRDHTAIWQSLLLVWGTGTLVSLGGLARSAWQVRFLVRSARALPPEEPSVSTLTVCARTAGVRLPRLLLSEDLPSPMLVGWLRPAILVPTRENSLHREVLLHELAHLRRADLWWLTLARIVGAAWWYHPLAWGITRRLERSAEHVCDDLVLLWTHDAPGYAGRLLQFARQANDRTIHGLLTGAAITGFRSELGKRVARILEPDRPLRVNVNRSGLASMALGAAVALALLSAVVPGRGQGENPMGRPASNTQAAPAAATTTPEAGIAAVQHKADTIIIPNLEFKATPLSEALEWLRAQSRLHDPDPDAENRGLNIFLKLPAAKGTEPPPAPPRITLTLSRIPLSEVLRYVANQTGLKLKVEPYAVSFVPLGEQVDPLITAEFYPPSDFLKGAASGNSRDPAAVTRMFLETNGVTFPPGASATFLPASNKLVVRNTRTNVDLIDRLVAGSSTSGPTPASQTPARAAQDSSDKSIVIQRGINQVAVTRKLAGIIVPNVEFDRALIADAVDFLRGEARRLDHDHQGVSIVLKLPKKAPDQSGTPPIPPRITLTLRNASLLDALHAVAAQAGLKVTVEPYAVSLSP